jgi:hypothetical protein
MKPQGKMSSNECKRLSGLIRTFNLIKYVRFELLPTELEHHRREE